MSVTLTSQENPLNSQKSIPQQRYEALSVNSMDATLHGDLQGSDNINNSNSNEVFDFGQKDPPWRAFFTHSVALTLLINGWMYVSDNQQLIH